MPVRDMPPRGRYPAREVGRLAGVSGDQIGQWARRGYIRSSQSRPVEIPRIYSFQDVAEAMVVHELRARDVGYPEIKHTIDYLRDDLGDWPLSRAELLVTHGGDDVVWALGAERIETARRTGQTQLRLHALERIRTDLMRGGWAARDLPGLQYIEVILICLAADQRSVAEGSQRRTLQI